MVPMLKADATPPASNYCDFAALEKLYQDQLAKPQQQPAQSASGTTGSLQAVHAHRKNLGIAEKFFSNQLHGQEWLSDLDLKRLLQAAGVSGVPIIPFTPQDIGMALHFAREAHKGTEDPYVMPMLLNIGATGSGAHQGNHWVYALATIDPIAKSVKFDLNDSMKTSVQTNAARKKLLQEAAQYTEHSVNAEIERNFQAFPDYTFTATAESNAVQNDGWTCGYRALVSLLTQLPAESVAVIPAQKKVKFEQLKALSGREPEELSTVVYQTLLENVILSPGQIQALQENFPSDANRFGTAAIEGDAAVQVDAKYLQDFLGVVSKRKASSGQISAADIALAKETALQLQALMTNPEKFIQVKDGSAGEVNEQSIAEVDFGALLAEGASSTLVKMAKIQALVQYFNQNAKIENVVLMGIEKIMQDLLVSNTGAEKDDAVADKQGEQNLLEFMLQAFEKIRTVSRIEVPLPEATPGVTEALNQAAQQAKLIAGLEASAARNELIRLLKLDEHIDAERNIWQQFCLQRFSNPNLFNDYRHPAYLTPVSFSNDSSFSNPLNRLLQKATPKFLHELLYFIDSNQAFFTRKEADFPFHAFMLRHCDFKVGNTEGTDAESENAALGHLQKCLLGLKAHLEAGKYFPFKELLLQVTINKETWANIVELVKTLQKYPYLEEFNLHILYDGEGLSAADLAELEQAVLESKLTTKLNIDYYPRSTSAPDNLKEEVKKSVISLNNISAINRRAANIALRTALKKPQEAVAEAIDSAPTSLKTKANRTVMLKRTNPAALNYELTAEQQLQAQTTLQQEVQQQVAVQAQAQNEVNAVTASVRGTLVDRAEFLQQQRQGNFIQSLGLVGMQCPVLIDEFSTPYDGSNMRKFWQMLTGAGVLNNMIQYFTEAALEKCLNFPACFADSIDIDRLPQGFMVAEHPDPSQQGKLVLDYSEIEATDDASKLISPLAPVLKNRRMDKPWLGDLRQFFPLNSTEFKKPDGEDFSEAELASFMGVFGRVSPKNASLEQLNFFMDRLNPELAKQIRAKHAWCLTEPATQIDQGFDTADGFILESVHFSRPTDLFLFADLLFHEDLPGLDAFLSALKNLYDHDPSLYVHYKHHFITHMDRDSFKQTIVELAEPKNIKLIDELAQLTPVQAHWWQSLVNQEVAAIGCADFPQLFVGFKYFLGQLPVGVQLPDTCPIQNSKNALLSLGRLLFILSEGGTHLSDQLNHLDGLDFSPEGAWYAARWDGLKFFHEKMQLTPASLSQNGGVDGKPTSYKVSYADLQKLPANTSIEDGLVRFYRFIAASSKIAIPFQQYIDLGTQLEAVDSQRVIKVLPLLALATTGRGAKDFADAIGPYVAFISSVDQAQLARVSGVLAEILLPTVLVTPNLKELTGLMQLLCETTKAPQEVLALLSHEGQGLSEKSLQLVALWQRNPQHLAADDFLNLLEVSKNLDTEHVNDLGRVLALAQHTAALPSSEGFGVQLAALKDRPNYVQFIKILSSLDFEKTEATHLPNLAGLMGALATLCEANPNELDGSNAFAKVAEHFPGCHFNYALTLPEVSVDLGALREKIAAFSSRLEIFGYEALDMSKLQGPEVGTYLMAQYALIMAQLGDKLQALRATLQAGGAAAQALEQQLDNAALIDSLKGMTFIPAIVFIAKITINNEFMGFLQGHFCAQVDHLVRNDGALKPLKALYPEPSTKGVDPSTGLAQKLQELQHYVDAVGGLFNSLRRLKSHFGSTFNFEFLINSPRKADFGVGYEQAARLEKILTTIEQQQFNFFPKQLFAAIFPETRSQASALDANHLTQKIIDVIGFEHFKVAEKAEMITALYSATAATLPRFDGIIEVLNQIKVQAPSLQKSVSSLLLRAFKSNIDIAPDTRTLLAVYQEAEKNNPVLTLIFERLAGKPQEFRALMQTLADIPEPQKQNFLKIFTYGYLERNYDSVEAQGKFAHILRELTNMAGNRPNDFKDLAELYQSQPFPRLAKLEACFTIPAAAFPAFVRDYPLDPHGKRAGATDEAKAAKLKAQFDVSSIHERIDGIINLAHDHPLFYSQRKALNDAIVYVNAVGHHHALVIPGAFANKENYQKPVCQLQPAEITALLRHYRAIISGQMDSTEQAREIARLEALALIREALYRVDGKLARDTQLMSILTTMLLGGNVASEIRTGEGKGLMAAFFAISKWLEGGAVDVCSANIELARRDQEEFKDFYAYLGIPCTLIRANSTVDQYQQDGINYPDVSEMALFQEQRQLNHEPLPRKVSLILDEADFALLDNTTQFRFSSSLDSGFDPHHNPNAWVYPLILKFLQENAGAASINLGDLQNFIRNLSATELTKAQKAKFMDFPDVLLTRWVESAYTALHLREGEDFVVRSSTMVKDEEEIDISVARVKINHRESTNSKFSDGVHQFLHARLNLESVARGNARPAFPIEPEKTYLAAKSVKNFVDYYLRAPNGQEARGNIISLTGTMGTKKEQKEMQENYGMQLVRIPPHEVLRRVDHEPILARPSWWRSENAETAHYRAILADLRNTARDSNGPPILIICDGVGSSNKLHAYLRAHMSAAEQARLNLFNGEQGDLRESAVVNLAGRNGTITISTPMFGRGTDIKPEHPQGLHVIATHISDKREFGQNIGRAGRNGQIGSSCLILSEAEFTSRGMATPRDSQLPSSIAEIRENIERSKSVERKEREAFADIKDQFFLQYTDLCKYIKTDSVTNFTAIKADYRGLWATLEHNNHLHWEAFLKTIDQHWHNLVTQVPGQSLEQNLQRFTQFANDAWSKCFSQIRQDSIRTINEGYDKAYEAYVEAQKAMPAVHGEAAAPTEGRSQGVIEKAKVLLQLPEAHQEAQQWLQGIALPEQAANVDLAMLRLNPADANRVYLQLAATAAAPIKNQGQIAAEVLTAEVDRRYKAMYPKAFLKNQDATVTRKIELLTEKLLAESPNHPNWFRANQCYRALLGAMDSFNKFGANDLLEPINAFNRAHSNCLDAARMGKGSLSAITAKINVLKLHGIMDGAAIKEAKNSWVSSQGMAWAYLVNYEEKSWKAKDRVVACRELKSLMGDLVAASAGEPTDSPADVDAQKLTALLQGINTASINAATSDYHHDLASSHKFFKSYRNEGGSEFQDTLNAMRSEVSAGLSDLAMHHPELHTFLVGEQIVHVAKLLALLANKIDLPGLEEIKAKIDLTQVNELLTVLQNQGLSNAEKFAQLSSFRMALAMLIKDNFTDASSKEKSFLYFLREIERQISSAEHVVHHAANAETALTPAGALQSLLQKSVPPLAGVNRVATSSIDLDIRYPQIVKALGGMTGLLDPAVTELILASLFETERAITMLYGSKASMRIKEYRCNPMQGMFIIKIDITAEDGQTFSTQIAFSELKLRAEPVVSVAPIVASCTRAAAEDPELSRKLALVFASNALDQVAPMRLPTARAIG